MTNEQTPNNLESKIMSQIKSGRLKLRSKYIFWAEKFGLSGALALTIILAILFFNLVLFGMKETDNLAYLSFGYRGLWAFLESFPYLAVSGFIVLILLAGYFIKKSGFSYKKPFSYVAVSLILLVAILGGILAYTSFSERLEAGAYKGRPIHGLFKPFFDHGMGLRGRGVAGIILEKGDDYLIIETPQGLQKVILSEDADLDYADLAKNQFIVAIGERRGHDFLATGIQLVNPDRLPMIHRGLTRQFEPFVRPGFRDATDTLPLPPRLLNFDEPVPGCVSGCLNRLVHPKECFDECL